MRRRRQLADGAAIAKIPAVRRRGGQQHGRKRAVEGCEAGVLRGGGAHGQVQAHVLVGGGGQRDGARGRGLARALVEGVGEEKQAAAVVGVRRREKPAGRHARPAPGAAGRRKAAQLKRLPLVGAERGIGAGREGGGAAHRHLLRDAAAAQRVGHGVGERVHARAGRGRVEAPHRHAGPAKGAARRRGRQRYRTQRDALRQHRRKHRHHGRSHHVAHGPRALAGAGGRHRVAQPVLAGAHTGGHEAVAAAGHGLHARPGPHAARRAAAQRNGAAVHAHEAAGAGVGAYHLEVHFEGPVVAVAAAVAGGVAARARRHREALRAAAAGAHRLVHHTALVEARGAAVYVLGHAAQLAEKGSVFQAAHAGRELGQVEVRAVGGALHGGGRYGQAGGGAAQPLAAQVVVQAAPAAHVHALAVIDQKSSGHQVGAVVEAAPLAKRRVVEAGGQVRVQLLNKLRAAGAAVQARRDGLLAQRLAQQVGVAGRVELQKMGLVVGAGADERGPFQRAAIGADAGGEAVGATALVAGAVGPGRGRKIERRSAAAHVHPALRVALYRVGGLGIAAAQQAGPGHGVQGRGQLAQQRIRSPAPVRAVEAQAQAGKVGGAGGRGHVHVARAIEQHVAAKRVAVVGRDGIGLIQHAIVAGAAQVSAGQQVTAGGAEAAHHQIRAIGHEVVGGAAGPHAKRVQHRAAPEVALRRPGRGGVVQRRGAAHHHQLVLRVHHQAVRKVGVVAAQVGGPHPRRRAGSGRVVFNQRHVDDAAESGAKRPRRGRKRASGVEHDAARVHVARLVIRRREAPVIGRRAGQGRELHRRVDGQGPRLIVSAQREAEGAAPQHVAAGHGLTLATGRNLPGLRGQLGGSAHRGFDDEVAGRVQGQGGGPVVAQGHAGGVGARGQQHIVFQVLGGVFVQRQGDARPQLLVAQLPEGPDVAGPAGFVLAHEVVALASRGPAGREAGAGTGFLEMHGVGVARNVFGVGGRTGGGGRPAVVAAERGGVQKAVREGIGLHKQAAGGQGRLVAHPPVPLAFILNEFQAGRARFPGGRPRRLRRKAE